MASLRTQTHRSFNDFIQNRFHIFLNNIEQSFMEGWDHKNEIINLAI